MSNQIPARRFRISIERGGMPFSEVNVSVVCLFVQMYALKLEFSTNEPTVLIDGN